jgi:hypothetical protein
MLTRQENSKLFKPPQRVEDEGRDEEHLHVIVQVPGLPNALQIQMSYDILGT